MYLNIIIKQMSEDRNKNFNVFNFDFNNRNSQGFPINNLHFNQTYGNMMNMNLPHNFNHNNLNNQFINGKRQREEIKEKSKIKDLFFRQCSKFK